MVIISNLTNSLAGNGRELIVSWNQDIRGMIRISVDGHNFPDQLFNAGLQKWFLDMPYYGYDLTSNHTICVNGV